MIKDPAVETRENRRDRRGAAEDEPARASAWLTASLCLFGVACLAATAALFAGPRLAEPWCWTEILLPLLACLAVMTSFSCRLPWQNVLAIAGIMLVFVIAILGCASVHGFPLGQIEFTDRAGVRLFGHVPLAVAFCWVAILAGSRDLARLVLCPWRYHRYYGYLIVGLAAVLVLATDLVWDPFAVHVKGFWKWRAPDWMPAWYTAPWVNFLGWFICATVILGFTAPWFIAKRPAIPTPQFRSGLVWTMLNLYFMAGCASDRTSERLWPAVIAGAMLTITTFGMAWRGVQWERARLAEKDQDSANP